MRRDVIKVALLGMVSGFMLALQVPGGAAVSDGELMVSSDVVIASLSWTCRSSACRHRGSLDEPRRQEKNDSGSQVRQDGESSTIEEDTKEATELYKQLDSEGKQLYDSLDSSGKQLAVRLAKQYVNKNQAVRVAAQQRNQSSTPTDD